MAIAIKSIPVLRTKAADVFVKKAKANSAVKRTVNFAQQADIASKILAKAKI